jgi:dTDP-4-amino-4,6-dideoxygalactose transaminase
MPAWAVPLTDVSISEDDIAAVAEVYRSGWLSMGPATAALEEEFARYVDAPHAIAVTNGTAGLHLICLALGLGPGDEVIVPSMTFVASVNAIRYTGATPVFADIAALERPWLSTAVVEGLIGPRTRAIMAVAYGGHAGEIETLQALAAEHGLALLEDAAHAAGSRLRGRHLGTFGAAAAFSFFSNKNLAVGEGGMVVTHDSALADRARLLRSHGMTSLTWDRHRGHAMSYDVVALGFNYRIDEARSALARRRLARLDAENARRATLDARYRAALSTDDRVRPALPELDGLDSAHHLFTVVLDEAVDRAAVREALAARGVQTSLHYPPVHLFSMYDDAGGDLPLTEAYGRRALTLPLWAGMTEQQQDLVIQGLSEAVA